MGVGDLNLLKSWNPNLLKNKKKVWKHEEELLQEEKKFKEKQQEIAKNRELEEASGKPVKKTGLEWMYNDAISLGTKNGAESSKAQNAFSNKNDAALGAGKSHGGKTTKDNTDRDILLGKKQYRGNTHTRTDNQARREQHKKALDKDDPMAGFMSKQKSKPFAPGNDKKRMELDRNDPMAAYKHNNRNTKVYKKRTYK
ncbi:hypothetical protein ACO0QE_002193 [Hanseniaspora vineae]